MDSADWNIFSLCWLKRRLSLVGCLLDCRQSPPLSVLARFQTLSLPRGRKKRKIPSTMTTGGKRLNCHHSSRRCPAGNIWKDFDTPWRTPEGVPGLEVMCVASKATCDRVVFLSALDRWVVDITSDSSGELTKCQGSTPCLVQPSVTSGPCTNSYQSPGPSLPFSLFKS